MLTAQYTSKDKVRKFIAHYPELFRGKCFEVDLFKMIYANIEEPIDFELVIHEEDIMRYILATMIMKNGRYEDTLIMNAYTLLDVYLGKHEDYSSILDIENRVICLYMGYSELFNKRQSDVIEYLVEQQRIKGHKLWLIYKGSQIDTKYPKLKPIIIENEGRVTVLPRFKDEEDSVDIADNDLFTVEMEEF